MHTFLVATDAAREGVDAVIGHAVAEGVADEEAAMEVGEGEETMGGEEETKEEEEEAEEEKGEEEADLDDVSLIILFA